MQYPCSDALTYSHIAEAKELPAPPDPEVTRMEFDMKDQMIRQTIMTTQEDVKEIKKCCNEINKICKNKAKFLLSDMKFNYYTKELC